MHLSRAYLGQILEKGGGLLLESSLWGGYLVSIVTLYIQHPHLLVTHSCHTVHNRVFVRDGTQDCAPGMGACSIRIYVNSPPISHQAPGIGGIPLISALQYHSTSYGVSLFPGFQVWEQGYSYSRLHLHPFALIF